MKSEYNVLQYSGYEKFKCIGGKCKHTCCAGWDITIDKKTYKKYKVSKFFTKEILRENFTKSKSGDIKFKLDDNGVCPMQNENGLCNIHANLGEDFLCTTCKVYPRLYNLVDNSIEKVLVTSCPAVNEMFLLNRDKMAFDSVVSIEDEKNLAIKERVDTRKDDYLKYFWDIRIFTISLLQNRDYDIEKRLTILGIVYNKLNELIKSGKEDKILETLELYNSSLGDIKIFDWIDELEININFKSVILSQLIVESENEYLKKLNENLKSILEISDNGVNEKYNLLIKTKYKKYIEEYEHTLENYLVNIVYSSAMPMSGNSILEKYLYLAIQYSLVKIYLISTDNENITEEDFIDVVTLLSRRLNHNYSYEKNIIDSIINMESRDTGILAKLISLLK